MRSRNVAAWHEPARKRRGSGFWLAFYVYLLALAGLAGMVVWKLWAEVLAQWPHP